MSAEKILIPASFYIGFNERSRWEDGDDNWDWRKPIEERGNLMPYRLGFATYFEDSARFRNRQSTVDRWASPTTKIFVHDTTGEKVGSKDKRYHAIQRAVNWGREEAGINGDDWEEQTIPIDNLQPQVIDNTPTSGFRIPHEVSRHSSWHRNTVWRIVDPRGWELEITAGNMANIMAHTSIQIGGIIDGACVWAWSMSAGGKLILLPVDSPHYLDGIKHTTRVAKKVSLKDVMAGDEVELANGTSGTWLGTYNLLVQEESARYSSGADNAWDGKVRRSFLRLKDGKFFIVGSPKVSSITKKISIPLDPDDILKEINTAVRERGTDPFVAPDQSWTPSFIFAYRGALKAGDYEMKLKPITEEIKKRTFNGELKARRGYRTPLWFLDQGGNWYVFHAPVKTSYGYTCGRGSSRNKDFFAQPGLGKAGFAELDDGIWDPQNLKVGHEHHYWGGNHRGGYHYGSDSLEEVIAKSSAVSSVGASPFAPPRRQGLRPYLAWDQVAEDVKCAVCKEFAKTTPHFVSEVEDLEWKEPVIVYDGDEYPIHI